MTKPPTPTKMTTALLQAAGYHVELVERRHSFNTHITVDLMSFADLLCFRPNKPILLVQATDGSDHSKRRRKVLAEPRARKWIEAGGSIAVVSWRRPVKDGVAGDWLARIDELTLADFGQEIAEKASVADGDAAGPIKRKKTRP